MMLPILPSDFNITGKAIPEDVVDKIVLFHLPNLSAVQDAVSFKTYVSANSGYRPKWYELQKGRSGNSEHTFYAKGAVDFTCENFFDNKDKLLEALIEHTNYTRIAEYNSFFHLDFKNAENDRWLYDKDWKRIKQL